MKRIKFSNKLTNDEKRFLYKLEREIESGDVYAMEEWATFFAYNHPELVTPEMVDKIVSYYETAINEGVSRAMLNLGAIYYNGVVVDQDFEKAVKLYIMAADSDDADTASKAIGNLGYCYYYGRSVAVNKEKAFAYFLKGAIKYNDPNCLYKLGDMYRHGDYVEKDEKLTYILYRKAFDANRLLGECCADIHKRLGECKLYGIGTMQDAVSALKHLTFAKGYLYEKIHIKNDPFAEGVLSKVEKLICEAEEQLKEM